MPRPRSSTFYLPLAPADAPLSLKAKLSVLPPSAANALLAPRSHPASAPAAIASTHTPVPPLDGNTSPGALPKEDECARLERVLGLCNSSLTSTPGARRTARRHTDAPLPSFHPSSGVNPFSLALTEQPADPRPTSSIQSLPSTSLGISAPAPAPAAGPVQGPDVTSTSPRIGASDMDAFASACAFGSSDITPVTLASDQPETSTNLSAPATTSTSRPASATAPSRPVTADRRRLSMVPCGLPKIWACRTLYPSKLCSSVSADDEDSTEQRRTILPHQLVLPPSIASCGSLHPLDARHLLPRHFRMSFPPPPPPCPAAATAATNPAPEPCAPCTDGINTSLTTAGLARTTTISTHSPADETALSPGGGGGGGGGDVATCVQMECDGTSDRVMPKALPLQLDESPVRITLTPPGPSSAQPQLPTTQSTPPPRQRYRLAPLYLHKVLRRSLGTTAWARAETVRLARAVEQAFGIALVSQAHVISSPSTSSSAIGRHTQWEDIVRSGYRLPPVDTTTTTTSSSLVWSGYEDVYIPGEGDQTNTSAGAAFSGQLSAGGANVWIQNVFDSAECAWDIDLEDEGEDDMEMDFDNEDFEAESDTTSSHFVRESAPEPEERRPMVVLEPTSPHTPVENSHESRSPASNVGVGLGLAVIPKPELEDTRSPSPDGYGGYAAVGKFTWGSEWPSSPTTTMGGGGARPPTGIARQWSSDKMTGWRMDEDGPPVTPPYHPVLSPSTYSSSSSLSSASASSSSSSSGLLAPFSHEEEENIFRYSPLQEEHVGYSHLPEEEEEEDDEPVFRYSAAHPDDEMEVDLDVPQEPHAPDHYIYEERSLLGATSPCTDTIPISLSPSFPPPPLIGTKISSCGESEDESDSGAAATAAQEEHEDEFYDVPSPSAAGVFIIPPSPLTKTSFGQPSPLATTSFGYSSPTVVGPSTPTSTSRFAHQQQQPPLVDDQAPRRSLERIRSSRRSMERIGPAKRSMEWIKPVGRNEYASASSSHEPSSPTLVAPRPRRASRALENVFSRQSPVFKTSALPNSPPTSSTLLLSPPSSALLLPTSPPSSISHLPTSPPLSASSPPLSPPMTKTGVAAWTFGSLKSALSNSVSQLVELARSRSPSPLPWLIRGGSGIAASSANAHATTLTLSGAATALASSNQATPSATALARHLEEAHESSSTLHTREPSSEELEAERASCVTPTPTSSRPRRASSTTITKVDAVAAVVSVPQVQLETTAGEVVVGTSPPPKRTLSTSSLSSLGSEPESESGSSGGVFSRSPSPEPDSRTWDASSLTPRSRPISADAKGAVSDSGRLSPMMIPGSWDPNELLWDDEDVANDQLRI